MWGPRRVEQTARSCRQGIPHPGKARSVVVLHVGHGEVGHPNGLQAEPLVLLKLLADRPQDRVDIVSLFAAGVEAARVVDYLRQEAPALVSRFASCESSIDLTKPLARVFCLSGSARS